MFFALLMLVNPAHSFRGGPGNFDSCQIGQIHFDGACRNTSWFDDLVGGGWTLEGVSGPALKSRDFVVLHESRDGKLRSVGLAPSGDTLYSRGGYPLVSRVIVTFQGQSDARFVHEVDLIVNSDVSSVLYKVMVYGDGLPNGKAILQNTDLIVDDSGLSGQTCDLESCSSVIIGRGGQQLIDSDLIYGGLIDSDLIYGGLIDSDLIYGGLIDSDLIYGGVTLATGLQESIDLMING